MERQYLFTERAHLMCPGMCFGLAALIDAPHDAERIRAAVAALEEAHPFLRAVIGHQAEDNRFFYDVTAVGKTDWTDAHEEILGFVTNVTLDYAFVWIFSWGMAGAAWATILGQAVTMIAAVAFFLFRRYRVERLPVKSLRACWGETLKVALAPFGLTFSPTVTMLLMNRFLLLYGSEQSVAVYGCIGYIAAIIYLLLQGVGDGRQPLISRYYGERNEADGRRMRSLAYRTALVVSAACMAAVFLAREKVGVLFGASETANAGVAQVLPYFLSTLLFLAFVRITTSCFYATEKTRLSYILVYAEPVCTLLFLLTLPLGLKLTGVWLAVPLAQTAAFLTALLAKRRVERV